jgi:hypothetical protein
VGHPSAEDKKESFLLHKIKPCSCGNIFSNRYTVLSSFLPQWISFFYSLEFYVGHANAKDKKESFCFIKLNRASVAIFLATDAQFLALFFYNGLAFL